MFGLGGMDPKKLQAVMKQMGIKTEQIDASKVIIEKVDGGKIVLSNPSVQKMNMQGQESWQITGEESEEADEGTKEEDVRLIMEKTGASAEKAKKALEEADGDIAEAILNLS